MPLAQDQPGLDLHHEQHVHARQQHGVDMQEIAGQDAACLVARNCRQVGDARRGAVPRPAPARIRWMVPSPPGSPG